MLLGLGGAADGPGGLDELERLAQTDGVAVREVGELAGVVAERRRCPSPLTGEGVDDLRGAIDRALPRR